MKKLLLAMMAILALVAARPAPASAADEYYIVGEFTNWEFNPDWKMTTDDGVTYTKENVTIDAGKKFKIATQNWDKAYSTAKTDMVNDTKYENCIKGGQNNDMAFSSKLENGKITIKIDTENTIITIGDPGDEPGPDTPTYYTGNLKVKYGVGSNWNEGIGMNKDSDWSNNHKWSYTFTAEANTGFVIRDAEGKDHKHATAFTDENPLQFDHAYTLDEGHPDSDQSAGNNFILKDAGSYTITVDASNKDAMTVTVSKDGSEDPQPTITYTLWSNIENPSWGPIAFDSNSEGVWTKVVENVNDKEFVIKGSDNKEYKPAQATEISTSAVTEKVTASDQDGRNFKFTTAGKYTITLDASNASNLTVTVTPVRSGDQHVDEWPANPEKFVYFNAGFAWERADRINKGKIYAHFIKKGEDIKEPADGDWRFEMKDNRDNEDNVNAMLPLFYAPVPVNADEYDGVQFEAENGVVYNTKKCLQYEKYDTEHWFDFIFTADNSVGGSKTVFSAEQSVMTYDEYRVRRDDPAKEAIYYCGSNIKGSDGVDYTENPDAWEETNFSGNVGISQASEGVFMFQLVPVSSGEDIKFKMSWVNANKRTSDYNTKYNRTGKAELTGGDKRWWATYNLGLVGPTLAPVYGGDLKKAEDKGDYKPAEGVDGNAAMKYIPRRCRKYSRYCSYDWWISKDMIENTTYYVIVDTYYKTTALIKYQPRPTLSSLTENAPQKNETAFSDDDAARYGNQLKGAQVHGTTLVKYANTVSGNATITPSANISELWSGNDYKLEYGIYYMIDKEQSESTIISSFTGREDAKRYSIEMDNLPYGKNVQVGVRCTYTDNVNSKYYVAKFRSFTSWKETTNEQQTAVVEASVSQPTAVRFLDNNLWHASASATINVTTSGDLAYYIDIDPDKNNREHPVRFAEASDFHVQANIGKAHYTASANNWANPRDLGNIDFVIDHIDAPEEGVNQQYDATFTVQVPYVVGDLTPIVKYSTEAEGDSWSDLPAAASVRRRANEAAPATRVDFAPIHLTTTLSDMALSGINDVMADGDAEAEYFNLQGVRVLGDIVPGVYIVRRGEKVSKEIVK